MASGQLKAIDQVNVGELVLSRDETTGTTSPQMVMHKWIHDAQPVLLLRLQSGEEVETTNEHRFYVAGRGFVPGGYLSAGDRLGTHLSPGVQLVATKAGSDRAVVYNLSVDRFNTYFVGSSGLWVHNVKVHPDVRKRKVHEEPKPPKKAARQTTPKSAKTNRRKLGSPRKRKT